LRFGAEACAIEADARIDDSVRYGKGPLPRTRLGSRPASTRSLAAARRSVPPSSTSCSAEGWLRLQFVGRPARSWSASSRCSPD